MTGAWNYEDMAAHMRPEQFELLLRAYVKMQAARACAKLGAPRQVSGSMSFRVSGDGRIERAGWHMCFDYGDDTKGEVLEFVVEEACRRQGWQESPAATLLQIEG